MQISNVDRSNVLVQALPYIQKFYGKTVVIKYGGNAMINEQLKQAVMTDIVLLSLVGIKVVLVHGGGPEINEMLQKIGKESKFVGGLRYTDQETMDIVQMVLAGKVNKDLVRLLEQNGGRAVGLCGLDDGMIKAHKYEQTDLGLVGEIESVDTALINDMLEKGYIPVISTVAGGDEVYNINADTAAAKIAAELKAESLISMTDISGINDKNIEEELRRIAYNNNFDIYIETDDNIIVFSTDRDLYSTMASLAFHVPYEDCREFYPDGTVNKEGKARRSRIKAVVLGLMYGRGDASVAEQLGITVEEARDLSNSLFQGFPKIKEYIEKAKAEAKKTGYTTTLWGRRRYLKYIQKERYEYKYGVNRPINFDPLFDSDEEVDNEVSQKIKDYYNAKLEKASYNQRRKIMEEALSNGIIIEDNGAWLASSERQVVNGIVQGSAADMTKRAMVALYNHEELNKLGFRLLMSVHDENIGECPIENVKRVTELLSEVMIKANDRCSVPMKCDAEISACWYGESIHV